MTSPTVVLVHGAFADASTWRGVYDHLARDGHTVLAPPNPLRGLPHDASYTESLIDQLDGPVVLAGHSYGGAVITVAGSSDKVVGLVYVAGVVPDEGESVNDLQERFPALAMGPLVQPAELADGSVEISIDPARFPDVFGATCRPTTRRSGRSHNGPWLPRRSTIQRQPLRGGRSRPGRCSAPATVRSLRSSIASPTSVPVRRSPRSTAPPTWSCCPSRRSSRASSARRSSPAQSAPWRKAHGASIPGHRIRDRGASH